MRLCCEALNGALSSSAALGVRSAATYRDFRNVRSNEH